MQITRKYVVGALLGVLLVLLTLVGPVPNALAEGPISTLPPDMNDTTYTNCTNDTVCVTTPESESETTELITEIIFIIQSVL